MNCPYLDMNLPRCSNSLNMQHLEDVFELCADHFELCPLYIELNRKDQAYAMTHNDSSGAARRKQAEI